MPDPPASENNKLVGVKGYLTRFKGGREEPRSGITLPPA